MVLAGGRGREAFRWAWRCEGSHAVLHRVSGVLVHVTPQQATKLPMLCSEAVAVWEAAHRVVCLTPELLTDMHRALRKYQHSCKRKQLYIATQAVEKVVAGNAAHCAMVAADLPFVSRLCAVLPECSRRGAIAACNALHHIAVLGGEDGRRAILMADGLARIQDAHATYREDCCAQAVIELCMVSVPALAPLSSAQEGVLCSLLVATTPWNAVLPLIISLAHFLVFPDGADAHFQRVQRWWFLRHVRRAGTA